VGADLPSGPLVNQLIQANFAARVFTSSRMNLHTHNGRRSRHLVVFVHGFMGNGYETWKAFPAFLFDGYSLDVALFDYPTFVPRIVKRVRIGFCIEMLADRIRELENSYDEIYLIGHSLGGIVVEGAVRSYLQHRANTGNYTQITPIAAVMLIASPIAGSGWALPILRRMIAEGSWLRRGSPQTRKITDYFRRYINNRSTASIEPGYVLLPCYSSVVGGDWFVNTFSAGFNIPDLQRIKLIPEVQTWAPFKSHIAIAKPATRDDPQVKWVYSTILEVNEIRTQWRRERAQAEVGSNIKPSPLAPIIVTEFSSGPDGTHWSQLYNEVRRSVGTADLEVYDHREVPGANVDLLMTASDAEAVLVPESREMSRVMEARARRKANYKLTVGISPVGERCDDAKRQVVEWLNVDEWLSSVYVEGAVDNNALRALIARWLLLVIGRDPRRGVSSSSRIEREIRTDLDPYGPPASGGVG
jgi:pimeloyl-ACP methyl ester carboxylesterase